MLEAAIQLVLFSLKTFIVFIFISAILIVFFALVAKSKDKLKTRLIIKNLNKKWEEHKEILLNETLPKKLLKAFLKDKKNAEKKEKKSDEKQKTIYVLDFHGDMKASAVSNLREEITTILNVASPGDEVVLRLESPGGVVYGYGLAAAQLMRLRARHIPLTIAIDKIAASGGYMMACIANKIVCSPFAIIGSIGIVVQLPNFHRLLKDKHIDFEQQTAGEFKRTITMFGENTKEGRKKLQDEIEDIHQLFKNLISDYRPQIDIQKVATGEHWVGQQALTLQLVDEIKTSDDYLFEHHKSHQIYEVAYQIKKPLSSRLASAANSVYEKILTSRWY